MTVYELIEKLKKMDQSLEVLVSLKSEHFSYSVPTGNVYASTLVTDDEGVLKKTNVCYIEREST